MWSSLTLSRQARSKARKDATEKDATEKVTEAEKKKLARAATFCYDSQHRNQKTKKHWLIGNIPNIKKKFSKAKSEKWEEKVDVSAHVDEKVVSDNYVEIERNDEER